MLTFEIVISKDTDKMIQRLGDYDRITDKHLNRAMKRSVIAIERTTKLGWPVGVSGKSRNSIASEVKETRTHIVGRVGSTMKKEVYPNVIEEGRKRGKKAPPPGALDRWVRIVMGIRDARKARSAAFLVGRKISRRGIKGKHLLKKAYAKNKPFVMKEFGGALKKITKDLAHDH